MSVNKISRTTKAVKSAILRKSVRTLPNNPSAKGYKAEEIKQAMYEFVTGDSNSVMNEQDRIVGEINTAIDEINESFEQRDANLSNHSSRKDNPHAVTASQLGLGNVNNTSDKDKPISNSTQQELNKKVNISDIVDNLTSDNADKPVSAKQAKNLKGLFDALDEEVNKKVDAVQVEQQLATKINVSEKGATNGVAMLGDDGKVPISQLPMSVLEQIIELVDFCDNVPNVGIKDEQYYNSIDKKIYTSNGNAWVNGETPLASKIYSVIAGANANKQYRWSGLDLVNIGSPLALGETSANAYPGDKGKEAYEHSLKTSGNPHGVTKEDIGLGNVKNKKEEELEVLSAKTLASSVNINGVPFDGSKDIEILDNTKIPILGQPVIVNEKLNISYDSFGRVTGGRELQDDDIPEVIARKEYVDSKETALKTEINKKVNKNFGISNAGKMLVVDTQGDISASDVPEGIDVVADLTGIINQNNDTLKQLASSAYMSKELNEKIGAIDLELDDVVTMSTDQTITGTKTFDRYKAKVKISTNDTRYLLSTPGNFTTTDKRYIVTVAQGNDVTASNSKVYSQNGKLYSNDTEVSVDGHTHDYLPLTGGTLTGNLTIASGKKLINLGHASDSAIVTRGIQGANADGTDGDLHLQNGKDYVVKFGKNANGLLNSDGSITASGATLSGDLNLKTIKFSNNDNTNTAKGIWCYGGDKYGNGIAVGAGGAIILGSGETTSTITDSTKDGYITPTSESTHILSDTEIKLYSNCQTWANRKTVTFGSDGQLTLSGTLKTPVSTTTYLNGNKGTDVAINMTAKAGYNILSRIKSTNGVFTQGVHNTSYNLYYTTDSTISAETNGITKQAVLLDETGNSLFPGVVKATQFVYKNTSIDRAETSTAPSSDLYNQAFQLRDKNEKTLCAIESGWMKDKTSKINLICYKGTTATDNTNARIEVGWKADGTAYTFAPSPVVNDNSNQIATTKWVCSKLLNSIYPVGSIYISTANTSPASFLGGTWTQIKGRFLLGAGANEANTNTTYGSLSASTVNRSAGEMGGEAKNTLTVSTMPSHTHNSVYKDNWNYTAGGSYSSGVATTLNAHGWTASEVLTASTGGGSAHNNMPPYLVVYMWKRTA